MADKKEHKDKQHNEKPKERKPYGKPAATNQAADDAIVKEGGKLIVRIANVDLKGTKTVPMSLTEIKGIGIRAAKNIATAFEKETGVSMQLKLGKLEDENVKKLEHIVLHPHEHHIPEWSFNRQKDVSTGKSTHIVMSDLDFTRRNDLQRMSETKSYRGLRHTWGLTVRGQRTKSTHRGKGGVVGVMKKDANAPAPAKPAAAGK